MSPGSTESRASAPRFAGKVVLVTGGAAGIGWAAAERFAEEGAKVWILDRDVEGARQRVQALRDAGGAADHRELDVVDVDAFASVVRDVVAADGGIDVLLNNAGVTHAGSVWETSSEDWARVLDINLTGTFNGIRAVFPVMQATGSGAIVNVSSDWGLVGASGEVAYTASKTGVVGLTRAAAMDGAPFGIRVNAVCPGYTDTELLQRWIANSDDRTRALEEIAAHQPLGRVGEAWEVAASIAFLASADAGFITGVALAVDGGVTAR